MSFLLPSSSLLGTLTFGTFSADKEKDEKVAKFGLIFGFDQYFQKGVGRRRREINKIQEKEDNPVRKWTRCRDDSCETRLRMKVSENI